MSPAPKCSLLMLCNCIHSVMEAVLWWWAVPGIQDKCRFRTKSHIFVHWRRMSEVRRCHLVRWILIEGLTPIKSYAGVATWSRNTSGFLSACRCLRVQMTPCSLEEADSKHHRGMALRKMTLAFEETIRWLLTFSSSILNQLWNSTE